MAALLFSGSVEAGSGSKAPSPPAQARGEGSVKFWSFQGMKEKCALEIKEARMYHKHRNTWSGMSESPWVVGGRGKLSQQGEKETWYTYFHFKPRLTEKGDEQGHC